MDGLWTVIVYWWRFGQCCKRWYNDRKNTNQLINAGKYSTSVMVGIFSMVYKSYADGHRTNYEGTPQEQINPWYIFYLCVRVVNSSYSWIWDCHMDWGLWRSKIPDHRYGLRKTINYPAPFYWWAVFWDFTLRFDWAINAFIFSAVGKAQYPYLFDFRYDTLIAMGELFRRFQWAILRIENEQVNNIEKYRTVLEIPDVNDYEDDTKTEELIYNKSIENVRTKLSSKVKE